MNNIPTLIEITLHWSLWISLYYLLLYKQTFFKINRTFLVSTLVLGVIIPTVQTFFTVTQDTGLIISIPELIVTGQSPNVLNYSPSNSNITSWLSTIYYVGSSITMLLFLFNIGKLIRLIIKMPKRKKGKYWLIELPDDSAPFSFLNFIFISRKETYTQQEWEQILLHEQAHSDHLHSVDILLSEMIKIVFWWNPLVYVYKYALRDIHEFQADQATTKKHNKKTYSRLLLRQKQSGMQVAITSNFIHSQLKKRIKMMMTNQSKKSELFRYLFILPVFVALFFVSCKTQEDSQQIENTVQSEEKEHLKEELLKTTESLKDKDLTPEKRAELQERLRTNLDELKKTKGFTKSRKSKQLGADGQAIYKSVDAMPQFQGCTDGAGNGKLDKCSEKALIHYIYNKIHYPDEAREQKLQGRVIASFIVNTKGKLKDIKVLRGIGGGCDEEVLSILEGMNDDITWTPGQEAGKNVNVQYILPVKFQLE